MKKHILCLGDSNTHGYCADPADCADGGIRFNEDERWTCLLQKALGEGCLVTEEGLSGRTTVFPDPLHESMDALGVLYSLLKSHEAVDLLIIMLGTNDTKERLGANAACIAIGMERLVRKAQSVDCWGDHAPNVLIVCPPAILPEMEGSRDMCILQADGEEGIYLAELDLEQLRRYREHEVHGNASRRPQKYGLLLDKNVELPFIRSDHRV